MKNNMFCKICLIAFFLLSISLKADEKQTSLCNGGFDTIALKDISFVNFFLCVPFSSIGATEKINKLAILDLEKFGKVIPTSLNIQNPTEGMDNPNSSFNSPSIFYTIENIRDMEGKLVDLAVASFELRGGANIKKTKDYFEPCFWSSKCYVRVTANEDIGDYVDKTLNFLLNEFNKDFQKDKNETKKISFYFVALK